MKSAEKTSAPDAEKMPPRDKSQEETLSVEVPLGLRMEEIGRVRIDQAVSTAKNTMSSLWDRVKGASAWLKDNAAKALRIGVGGAFLGAQKGVEGVVAGAGAVKKGYEAGVSGIKKGASAVAEGAVAGAGAVAEGAVAVKGAGFDFIAAAKQQGIDVIKGYGMSIAEGAKLGKVLAEQAVRGGIDMASEAGQRLVAGTVELVANGYDLTTAKGRAALDVVSSMAKSGVNAAEAVGKKTFAKAVEIKQRFEAGAHEVGQAALRAYEGMRDRISGALDRFNQWRNDRRLVSVKELSARQAESDAQMRERIASLEGQIAQLLRIMGAPAEEQRSPDTTASA